MIKAGFRVLKQALTPNQGLTPELRKKCKILNPKREPPQTEPDPEPSSTLKLKASNLSKPLTLPLDTSNLNCKPSNRPEP